MRLLQVLLTKLKFIFNWISKTLKNDSQVIFNGIHDVKDVIIQNVPKVPPPLKISNFADQSACETVATGECLNGFRCPSLPAFFPLWLRRVSLRWCLVRKSAFLGHSDQGEKNAKIIEKRSKITCPLAEHKSRGKVGQMRQIGKLNSSDWLAGRLLPGDKVRTRWKRIATEIG